MSFENVDRRTTTTDNNDGQRIPRYIIGSPTSIRLRWAKQLATACASLRVNNTQKEAHSKFKVQFRFKILSD